MAEAPKICAACGEPIVQHVGQRGRSQDFCSPECLRLGRAFCKLCEKPIIQPPAERDMRHRMRHRKDFCSPRCQKNYYHGAVVANINPSLHAELHRSTCKACGKPITQPVARGGRMFCSKLCGNRYRDAQKRNQSALEAWGSYAPETREALQEVQQLYGLRMAQRVATAIDREYMRRRPDTSRGDRRPRLFLDCQCKTCGKAFRRRPWTLLSTEYCSRKCHPDSTFTGGIKLTWEKVDTIRELYATSHTSTNALAEKYGVGNKVIWNIIQYKIWKPENRELSRREQQTSRAKLTWEKVDEIRTFYATGQYTNKILGEMFDVSESAIRDITAGATWKPE